MANRRKRDIAALERQLAELNLEEPSSSDTAIENIELGAIEVKQPSPCAGVTVAWIGSVTEKLKLILVCFDSGAEITVLAPEIQPETPTEESEERRSGVAQETRAVPHSSTTDAGGTQSSLATG